MKNSETNINMKSSETNRITEKKIQLKRKGSLKKKNRLYPVQKQYLINLQFQKKF